MSFSTERAMAHVRALDFSRYRGTGGARRAADSIAEGFAAAGLVVQRIERPWTVSDLVARHILLVIAPGPLALLTMLALPGWSLLGSLGLTFAWMVSLALGLTLRRRL